jgi:hypothetical protein
VLGWGRACTFHYRPWTGSIKPSLQHFHFCHVFLWILIFSILKRSIENSIRYRLITDNLQLGVAVTENKDMVLDLLTDMQNLI